MAEHDQENDEYNFGEFDNLSSGDGLGGSSNEPPGEEPPEEPKEEQPKDVKRNALIVVGIVVGLVVLYKVGAALFGGSKAPEPPAMPPVAQVTPQPVPSAIVPPPIQPVVREDTELKQKVNNIEMNEQNIKTDVGTLKDQVNTVDSNVNNLNAEIAKLNQAVTDLTNQVSKQSTFITMLTEKIKRKPRKPKFTFPQEAIIHYNLQAVIPGRAWLIGSNGSTLTIREGTKVRGYGVVKLIDSIQGRVITSSGKIIRFSQNDS